MKDEDLIVQARANYKTATQGWDHIYKEATDDLKFVYDVDEGQWPAKIKSDREGEGRPVITVNKLQKFVRQLRGEAQMNRPRIKVVPVDDKADVRMAELYNGLIRQIEYLSNASIAYDTAYMGAVSCSMGFFRLITKYSDDMSFDQDIHIKRILNPMSVHFDPTATEFQLEDAKYGFVDELVHIDEYKRLYPGSDATNFDTHKEMFGEWIQGEKVRIAEYFYKNPIKKKIVLMQSGEIHELTKDVTPELLQVGGDMIVRDRDVDTHEVKWCKINGGEVLKRGTWPGKNIPIIPVFGDEVVVDGKRYYLSLTRGAKGSQEMYNYWADLCLKTPIPTPNGWTTIGELDIGDSVFDELGKQCFVIGASPVLNKEKSYKITFSDKSTIITSPDHLWTVEEKQIRQRPDYKTIWKKKTIPTEKLSLKKHRISLPKPLELSHKKLPVQPYVLGLWLADGDSKRAKIFAHKKTVDELSNILESEGMVLRRGLISNASETYGMALLGIRNKFVKLNLLENKHIPLQYLRASFKQRVALLQGLMDGDGSNAKNERQCRFATAKLSLAIEFSELLRSLGIKGNFNKEANGMYCFTFTPYFPSFRLKYKLDKQNSLRSENKKQTQNYRIISIKEIEAVATKCITVDSKSHLFLAGECMIPTHNTAATETVALAPKMPFILEHRQIKGFEGEWDEANIKNRMYIRYNAIAGIDKPKRESQAEIPSGIVTMMQATAFDIEDHLGRYEASKGQASNERSGKAIVARIQQADKGTYTFVDNLTRAIVSAGRQLIDLIPKIYDTPRALRVRDEADGEQLTKVNQPATDGMGNFMKMNDLSVGKYDLVATVGASFASKRQEMVEMMIQSMQYAPAVAPIIAPLIFKFADFPGAQEVYSEIQKEIKRVQENPPEKK